MFAFFFSGKPAARMKEQGEVARHDASMGSESSEPVIVDVWSRTMPKYRRRAVLLLLTNAILFGGLCCFSYWLRTGKFLAAAGDNYWSRLWSSFRPTGDVQVTLSDLLVYPIHFQEVPLQIPILGLLMASLISIPIVVAILYRFPFSPPTQRASQTPCATA